MPSTRNYYDDLGVGREATAEEIRQAYRQLARKHHPDVSNADDAAERFAAITEAYEVLGDPEKRREYDRFGRVGGPRGVRDPGGPAGWAGGVDAGSVGSIFEDLFGGSGSPFGGGQVRPPRPRRGEDIEHTIAVTFMTAALGGQERLRMSSASQPSAETIDIKIPAGISSGAKLRVKGKGQASPSGGAAGDLILTVQVGAHPFYRREGLDLLTDVPLTLAEAALGTTVTVPLMRGSAEVRVPPGTSSGQKLRIKGKGIVESEKRRGDFLAVIQIVAPTTLSPRAKELIEELGSELQNPRESGPWSPESRDES